MRFALQLRGQRRALPEGRFLIGRGDDCQLTLDDPLASRVHAALLVRPGRVVVEDLGSRNGVRVNGERVEVSKELAIGDVVRIGAEDMALVDDAEEEEDDPLGASTLVRSSPTQRIGSFEVLTQLADKALALGRIDEAERILSKPLETFLASSGERPTTERSLRSKGAIQDAQERAAADVAAVERAARYGLRLAAATGKGRWLDYLFRLHASRGQLMQATLVDELYDVVRRVQGTTPSQLEAYLEVLRAAPDKRGPSDRFLIGRLEGVLALLR